MDEKKIEKEKIINIVAVEDEDYEYNSLVPMLSTYFSKKDREFHITRFVNGNDFISNYKTDTDIVLMDIELKDSNGMEAAQKLRSLDKDVIIIFTTKMAQFAVKGYQVNALDFIIKPYSYDSLSFRLDRAMRVLDERSPLFMVKTKNGLEMLNPKDILYIDVFGHSLGFHTEKGTIYVWGVLSEYEEKLAPYGFIRCSNSALVNFAKIKNVQGMDISMTNGDSLQISHPRRKSFMTSLAHWAGFSGK